MIFCHGVSPSERCLTAFVQSSARPTAIDPSDTSSSGRIVVTHAPVYAAHSTNDTMQPSAIISPPIIGVPRFFRCSFGPSSFSLVFIW